MSPTATLSKSLLWAFVPLAIVAISVALQHGVPAQTLDFVHTRARQALFAVLHPSRSDCNDAVTGNGSISQPQSVNQSSFGVIRWHPRAIEYNDLVKVATIQEGRLEVVQHPDLGPQPALVKRAARPEYVQSISHETKFYRLLDGLGVTPTFLGHVTEAGRITGFLAEYVEQQAGKLSDRASGTEACLSALRRIHARGVAHRDAHGGNCLLRGVGSAAVVDFELAEETSSEAEFERDLWVMRHSRDAENVS